MGFEGIGASVRRKASRIPGTARIGPMLMIGFDGQTTIPAASRITASNPGAGRAFFAPAKDTASTLSRDPRRTKYV